MSPPRFLIQPVASQNWSVNEVDRPVTTIGRVAGRALAKAAVLTRIIAQQGAHSCPCRFQLHAQRYQVWPDLSANDGTTPVDLIAETSTGQRLPLARLVPTTSRPDPVTLLPVYLRRDPYPLYHPGLDLGLIFAAKAGCTFGLKWFLHHTGLLRAAQFYQGWLHDFRLKVYVTSRSYLDHVHRLPVARSVCLVRNPFDRATSSYIHALRCGYEDAGLQAFLGRPVDAGNGFSFREFLAYLETLDLRMCDVHHLLQLHGLIEDGLLTPTWTVKLEEAMTRLPEIERELGLSPAPLAELRRSSHHTIRNEDPGPVTDQVFHRKSHFPDAPAFYDEVSIETVARLYAPDFAAFGYSTRFVGDR